MVALEIILDIGLPVAANRVARAMRDVEAVPIHAVNLGRERGDDTCERLGVKVHIDEYEATPAFAPEGEEREFARIEICSRTEIARQGEAAIECVAPAMVAAGKSRAASALAIVGKRTRAMTADIVESTQTATFVADDT